MGTLDRQGVRIGDPAREGALTYCNAHTLSLSFVFAVFVALGFSLAAARSYPLAGSAGKRFSQFFMFAYGLFFFVPVLVLECLVSILSEEFFVEICVFSVVVGVWCCDHGRPSSEWTWLAV